MASHDVLIVGGGLAGLRSAIAASKERDVAVISQVHPLRSNSVTAEGGINASLDNERGAGRDSVQQHISDTMAAGEQLNHRDVVEILCAEAASAVLDLERWGAPFDRMAGGLIAQRRAEPRAFPRTCFAGEHVGHALLNTLFEQIVRWGIKVYEEHRVLALAVEDGQCFGVVALVPATGELVEISARAVILATGGCGRLYKRSANTLHSIGSGVALACRAGAPIADMEFIQFHPLATADGKVPLPERLLEAGGRLLNAEGERFLDDYQQENGKRVDGAVLTRLIAAEIAEGRGFEDGCVRLDLSHLSGRKLSDQLGRLRQELIAFAGADPVDEPIPVAPAQGFSIGGLATDEHGATCIDGLFAAGECACVGAHGARALGGNSILEAVVFGKRAGEQAAKVARKRSPKGGDEILKRCRQGAEDGLKKLLSNRSGENAVALRRRLSEVLWDGVGVLRSASGLTQAGNHVRECREQYAKVDVSGQSARFNSDLMAAIELGEMLDLAEAIVMSAAGREETRGNHIRSDHKEREESWLKHTIVRRTESGAAVSYEPVRTANGRREPVSGGLR